MTAGLSKIVVILKKQEAWNNAIQTQPADLFDFADVCFPT